MSTAATSADVSRFFGPQGAWKEACEYYTRELLPGVPEEIREHSKTLGDARIAFCLGYGLAMALHRRHMTISDDELDAIYTGRSSRAPDAAEQFRNGFRRFQP